MYRYQIINADNQILRFITVSGSTQERHAAIEGKMKHLYGNRSCFLKAELVSEKYYQEIKEMFSLDKANKMFELDNHLQVSP